MLFSIAGSSWQPWAANQLLKFGFFFVLMIVLAMVDIRVWFALAYPIYGIGLVLLLAVAVVGDTRMGATRWLELGPLSFQPSEVMKIGIVLALARFYHGTSAQNAKWSWWLLVPAALVGMPALLVAKQPDLGTAMLIALSGLSVVVLAGLSWRVILAGMLAVAVAAPPFIMFGLHDYQRKRIFTFLDPESDPSGSGYHILQSKIALGSGGLFGKGFMQGTQAHLNFLPEKQTDFIFTMLGEELGFVGALALLILYAIVLAFSPNVALQCRNQFGRLLAMGVAVSFFFYVFINTAMVMGLLPVVGVPLPLVSYGGTAMLSLMFAFGLLMSCYIHRNVEISRGPTAFF